MIIAVLVVLGLCFGSFINALVWRVHEQATEQAKKRPSKKRLAILSISRGRSICPHCSHQLAAKDLVPVLSWLSLGGKCRYCRAPIGRQYPLVELLTMVLFVASYICWPSDYGLLALAFWLVALIGLIALAVYDLKWLILPNRILYPTIIPAVAFALTLIIKLPHHAQTLVAVAFAVAIGGGIFYIIYAISDKLIGFGDVRLGFVLGLLCMTPGRTLLYIFAGSLLGSIVSLVLMSRAKAGLKSQIPFGPFLIAGAIVVQLLGEPIIHWYTSSFIL